MAFDGRDYLDAEPVYPSAYHSKAPLTGPALGRVLRIAYLYARRHGQLVICQNYPLNFRNRSQTLSISLGANSTFSRIAEGFRYVPDQTTHLAAQVIFKAWAAEDTATAYHRVSLRALTAGAPSGTPDTGSTVETAVISLAGLEDFGTWGSEAHQGDVRGTGIVGSLHEERNVMQARCEVELSNVAAGQDCEIYVEGYAAKRASGAAVTYTPMFISAWWEVRG